MLLRRWLLEEWQLSAMRGMGRIPEGARDQRIFLRCRHPSRGGQVAPWDKPCRDPCQGRFPSGPDRLGFPAGFTLVTVIPRPRFGSKKGEGGKGRERFGVKPRGKKAGPGLGGDPRLLHPAGMQQRRR